MMQRFRRQRLPKKPSRWHSPEYDATRGAVIAGVLIFAFVVVLGTYFKNKEAREAQATQTSKPAQASMLPVAAPAAPEPVKEPAKAKRERK